MVGVADTNRRPGARLDVLIQPDLHGNAFVRADDGKEHAQDDHPLWF